MKKNKYTSAPLLCWDVFINGIHKEITDFPIGGFQKQSLIDYPGNVSAVIFTCGCNFRCNYCHNPELVYPDLISNTKKQKSYQLIEWISKNKGLLDAIVITGGEPTIHPSLPAFIRKLRSLGFKIKLDTNGTNPSMLESLIASKHIDYVAMDIKAPLLVAKYKQVAGSTFNNFLMNRVIASIEILNKSRIDCEFRTTLDKSISLTDIQSIIDNISRDLYIQPLRKNGTVQTSDSYISELKNLAIRKKNIRMRVR